jgi:Rad3-related DNA helicase
MHTLWDSQEAERMEQDIIRISVRNLVEFILRSGDIDNRRGGFGEKEAMQEGSRIHRKIQGKMGSGYQAEVALAIDLPGDGYVLRVEGRADGVFCVEGQTDDGLQSEGQAAECTGDVFRIEDEPLTVIDEIKGMYRDVHTLEVPVSVHLAQAKCYACMYGLGHEQKRMGVQMTYCNLETEEIRRFRETYDMKQLETWFQDVVGRYHRWAKLQKDWMEVRQSSIHTLQFPYPWRDGQKELAAAVYRTVYHKKTLFIQAPTGTGKTLSTVFPAVKAVGEGLAERIFYGTAKTVTRTVAEEAFALLRQAGLRWKTVTLTARERICPLDEPECNPDACMYAKGHFDRVNDAVYELISEEEVFSRERLEEQARKWTVCPFELGLDVALWADGIICDYNYIFDPRARLRRFFGEGVKGEYLFLIDEAHNLVERGRDMFSASLYKEDFLALKKEILPYSPKMSRALNRCNTWMLEQKRACEGGLRILENTGTFALYLMNLSGIMETFLEQSEHRELNEKVLDLYFQIMRFLDTSDCLNDHYVIYTEIGEDGRFLLRLYCVDVSERLQECLDRGRSTIYFSATLLPVSYYRSLLSAKKDDYAIYAKSTFRPERRLVLLGTDTSSRYSSRCTAEFRRMAEYVLRVIESRRGNYMVFFSSYRMMEDVAEQFGKLCEEREETVTVLCQSAGMREKEREEFLKQFEQVHEGGLAGFCVMGGIFGEGIDLKRDRLIGAIVVGTGLPQVCNEREILRQFYDRRGEDGFFYAYTCPGMNKVLQSAGRVIRTEEDAGVVLLLDDRFASNRYRQMFPAEWENVQYCTLQSVRDKTDYFWQMLPDCTTL